MNLMKFTILKNDDASGHEFGQEEMLINLDHIVSLKPIRIVHREKLLQGYWLRLSNGKKYRATSIPDILHQRLALADTINTENRTFEPVVFPS